MCEDISIADDFDAWLGVVSGGVSLLIRPTETNPTLPDIFQMHHSIPVSKVACGMISQKEPLIQQYLTFKRLLYLKYRYLMRRLWLLNIWFWIVSEEWVFEFCNFLPEEWVFQFFLSSIWMTIQLIFYLFIFHYIYNIEISHGCLVLNCIWRVSIWILEYCSSEEWVFLKIFIFSVNFNLDVRESVNIMRVVYIVA